MFSSIYGKPAEKTVKYTDDIELMTFSPDAYFFANVSVNPDNAGFCTPPGNCLAAGLLNLTSCLDGKRAIIRMTTKIRLLIIEKM